MSKFLIDLTSDDFRFISKEDEDPYWVSGTSVICEGDYTERKPNKFIHDGYGFFRGLTMVSYRGYDGELPREAGDTSGFGEFDIYYKDILINDMSYGELELLINSEKREEKLKELGI